MDDEAGGGDDGPDRMDQVVAAVADPVRRRILEMLRDEPLTAGRIAAGFPISRPAISRHLRVLRESGLVRDTAAGRERRYELDPIRLTGLRDWLDGLLAPAHRTTAGTRADMWHRRLDSLRIEVHRTRRDHRRGGTAAQEETA